MSMVFCSSLMLKKSSNHSSSTRDLKISLAFVMNKTPYSHFLLTVFIQCTLPADMFGGSGFWLYVELAGLMRKGKGSGIENECLVS